MGISDVKTGGFWSGCEALFRPAVFRGQCGQYRVKGLVERRAYLFWTGTFCAVNQGKYLCLLFGGAHLGRRGRGRQDKNNGSMNQ